MFHEIRTTYTFTCERQREVYRGRNPAPDIEPDHKAQIVLNGDRTLPELCEEFCNFLRASGFWLPPGGLEYVEDEPDTQTAEDEPFVGDCDHEESVDGPKEDCAICQGISIGPEGTGEETE